MLDRVWSMIMLGTTSLSQQLLHVTDNLGLSLLWTCNVILPEAGLLNAWAHWALAWGTHEHSSPMLIYVCQMTCHK